MTNTATPSPQAAVHGSDIEGAQTSVHRVECRDNEGVSARCLGQIEDDGLGVSILLHRDQPPLAAEAALFVAAAGHTGHEVVPFVDPDGPGFQDRKSTRLNPVTHAHIVYRCLLTK